MARSEWPPDEPRKGPKGGWDKMRLTAEEAVVVPEAAEGAVEATPEPESIPEAVSAPIAPEPAPVPGQDEARAKTVTPQKARTVDGGYVIRGVGSRDGEYAEAIPLTQTPPGPVVDEGIAIDAEAARAEQERAKTAEAARNEDEKVMNGERKSRYDENRAAHEAKVAARAEREDAYRRSNEARSVSATAWTGGEEAPPPKPFAARKPTPEKVPAFKPIREQLAENRENAKVPEFEPLVDRTPDEDTPKGWHDRLTALIARAGGSALESVHNSYESAAGYLKERSATLTNELGALLRGAGSGASAAFAGMAKSLWGLRRLDKAALATGKGLGQIGLDFLQLFKKEGRKEAGANLKQAYEFLTKRDVAFSDKLGAIADSYHRMPQRYKTTVVLALLGVSVASGGSVAALGAMYGQRLLGGAAFARNRRKERTEAGGTAYEGMSDREKTAHLWAEAITYALSTGAAMHAVAGIGEQVLGTGAEHVSAAHPAEPSSASSSLGVSGHTSVPGASHGGPPGPHGPEAEPQPIPFHLRDSDMPPMPSIDLNHLPGAEHPELSPVAPPDADVSLEVSATGGMGYERMLEALHDKLKGVDVSKMSPEVQQIARATPHELSGLVHRLAIGDKFFNAEDGSRLVHEGATLSIQNGQLHFEVGPHETHIAFDHKLPNAPHEHLETARPAQETPTTDQLNADSLARAQAENAANDAYWQAHGGGVHAGAEASSAAEAPPATAPEISTALPPLENMGTVPPHVEPHPLAETQPAAPEVQHEASVPPAPSGNETPHSLFGETGPNAFVNPIGVTVDPDATHGYLGPHGEVYAYGGKDSLLNDSAQDHVSPERTVYVDESYSWFGIRFPRIIEYVFTRDGAPPAMVVHHDVSLVPDPKTFQKELW